MPLPSTTVPQAPSHPNNTSVGPLPPGAPNSSAASPPSAHLQAGNGASSASPLRSAWDWFEIIGKRFGWIISTASVVIASIALNTTLKKNGADAQAAITAQRQGSIAQAFSTLQVPSAPGTSRALQLIAHEQVSVNGLHLEGAYLQYGNFRNLRANDAVFDHANLNGVDFTGAEIPNSSFVGAEVSGGNFRRIGQPPTPTRTVNAEFRVVPKGERDPRRVIVTDTSYRMDFSKSNLRGAAFDHALIPNALFRNAQLGGTTFIGAVLAGADFVDADTTNG